MDLQFEPHAHAHARPSVAARPLVPQGRMHLLHDGFLYAGRVAEATSQRHSVLVCLSLDAEAFTIETRQGRLQAEAALVAPGVRKRIVAGAGRVACIDVNPTHRGFRTLARVPATAPVQALPRVQFEPLDAALHAFLDGRLGDHEAGPLHRQLVRLAAQRAPEVASIDPRVREVMRLLREDRRRSAQSLAEAVGLSKDWLLQLFQREAGVSLSKYEQVLRLQAAGAFVKRGVSMGEVAAIAGFADAAHFSKVWKQHYGFPPHRLFAGRRPVTIDPLPWPSCGERGHAAD
ncbi:MAG: helix-turn-helix domain-containing protein [Rhizobacter sp.]|nr:helix-turn-helix domain-containing protein [Rhizobacter sp.]